MKRILLFSFAFVLIYNAEAQVFPMANTNDLEVIDTGNITREQWRDSLLRMDMSLVPTGFLLEYSMFGFDTSMYNGVGMDIDTI